MRLFSFAEKNCNAGKNCYCGKNRGNLCAGVRVMLGIGLYNGVAADVDDGSFLIIAANLADTVFLGLALVFKGPIGKVVLVEVKNFAAASTFLPVVLTVIDPFSAVVVTESFEHDVFGLGLRPICGKGCGVSSKTVGKALRLGYYRIGRLYGFGFNMGSVTVANTLCGYRVAALNRFPFVGGCSPIMTESIEHDVLGLGLCPIYGKGCGVSALAVH